MRIVVGIALLCACHHAPGGQAGGDAGVDGESGSGPKLVVATAPGWLHEDIRLELDQELAAADVSVTASLAGVPIGASAAIDPSDARALAVVIDPAARGTGALAVHVEGKVTGTNGISARLASDVAATFAPWSGIATSLAADGTPAIAVTGSGGVLAAWISGGTIATAIIDRGAWQPLGGPAGAQLGASPLAVAIDGTGRPLLAWSDGTAAHVARHDASGWQELASPGAAAAVAIAGGDAPIVALFGASVSLRALGADDTWSALAPDMPCMLAGEPLLAAAGDRVAVAWLDGGGTLHAFRVAAGAWTELAPIAAVRHASLAVQDDAIAIAYEQFAGSSTVLAAELAGDATTWTPLGHALDAGPADDAVAPAIAIDSTGAPVVAWTEDIAARQRGLVARWDGAAWTIGPGTGTGTPTGVTASWLPDPSEQPSRSAFALHADAPVIAAAAGGRLVLARFNGPPAAPPARAPITGCAFDPANPPALLSQTGCFPNGAPHAGLVPYGVVVELWTDGAKKRRWIGLPGGAAMTATANGSWDAPPGTFVIKEFALESTPGDPSTRRPVETRFLARTASGWSGVSYRWQLDGRDATLEPDAEDTFAWPMDDGSAHTHFYPSRTDCGQCHQASNGPLLGVRPAQLARWFDYGGVIAEQPAMLAQLGVGPAADVAPLASPHDPSQTLELRTRGYMAGNCAHCHNPSDVAVHDLRWETPLASTNLCPDIAPGNPAGSRTYQLVSSRPGMPPIGTLSVDPIAIDILGRWISSIATCP